MTMPDEDLTPSDHLTPEERDPEAPAHDAVEQAISANPADDAPEVHRGLEVNDYDAIEQAHVVDLDEEYREG
jgi:hypothetical protein